MDEKNSLIPAAEKELVNTAAPVPSEGLKPEAPDAEAPSTPAPNAKKASRAKKKAEKVKKPPRFPRLAALIEKLRKWKLYLPLFFLTLLFSDLLLRWVFQGASNIPLFDETPMKFTLCWCALLTGISLLLPRIVKRVFIMLIVVLDCVLILVHAGMFSFFHRFFSFSDIAFAGDGAEFFEWEYFHFRKSIILGILLALGAGVVACILVPRKERYSLPRWIAGGLLLILPVVGIFSVRRNVLKTPASLNWDNYRYRNAIYDNFTDSTSSLLLTGLHHYTFRDFCLTYRVYDLFADNSEKLDKLDAYYKAVEPDPDNEMTGVFRGKNLILIQLEAIDTWLINDTCMPYLKAVRENSIDFTNNYAPMYLSAGTFNTENIVNTGMVSPASGSITMYSRNPYPLSAAHLFEEAGYTANSFHGSPGSVYDREVIHKNWGYEKYHSGDDMGLEDYSYDSQLIEAFDLFTSKEHPFFSFIITISGHGPYKGSKLSASYYDKFAALLPEDTDEMIIHAYAHAYETDLFVKALMERLETEGLLDNTVLVFYADHYDYYVVDDALIMEQKGVQDKNLIMSTPFFIYSKDMAPRKVEKVTSTIDILPTVVNLFDLNTDGRYYVGNDAFSDNGGYVIFPDYSWYDGTTYWKAGVTESDDPMIGQRNQEIQTRMNNSRTCLQVNYFGSRELIR